MYSLSLALAFVRWLHPRFWWFEMVGQALLQLVVLELLVLIQIALKKCEPFSCLTHRLTPLCRGGRGIKIISKYLYPPTILDISISHSSEWTSSYILLALWSDKLNDWWCTSLDILSKQKQGPWFLFIISRFGVPISGNFQEWVSGIFDDYNPS